MNIYSTLELLISKHWRPIEYNSLPTPQQCEIRCNVFFTTASVCHVKKRFLKRFCKKRIDWTLVSIFSEVSKYNWTKVSKGPNASRMGQGYIQSNPPHVVSYLGFICTRLQLSKIPSFCCLHDTIDVKSETWGPHIDYVTSNLEANAFDVSPAMVSHLTSYYHGCAWDANWYIFQFSWSQKWSLRKIKAVTGKSEIYVF